MKSRSRAVKPPKGPLKRKYGRNKGIQMQLDDLKFIEFMLACQKGMKKIGGQKA